MADATEATGRTGPVEFVGEVQDEIRKVTWPDWPQLQNATGVILVFMVIVASLIFGIDTAVNLLLNLIRGVFGG
jgi:preprotein translocase subunit SecE